MQQCWNTYMCDIWGMFFKIHLINNYGWYKPWWDIKIWPSKGCSVILFALYEVSRSVFIWDLTVIALVPFYILLHYFNENKERLTEIWWICDGRSICQNDEHNGNVKTGTSTHLPPVVSSKIIWVHFKFLLRTKENKNKMEMTIDDKKTFAWFHEKFVIKTQTLLVMK